MYVVKNLKNVEKFNKSINQLEDGNKNGFFEEIGEDVFITKAGKNKSGIAHRTIRHIETWMKNVMQHAEDEQLITKNYYSMKSYEFITVKDVEKEVWSLSVQQKLMKSTEDYASEINDQRWYAFTFL